MHLIQLTLYCTKSKKDIFMIDTNVDTNDSQGSNVTTN